MGIAAAPIYLVIQFPESAEHLTQIAQTLIPWLAIVFLLATFNEGIKQVFAGLAGALSRIKKFGVSGVTSEFEDQQRDVSPLTKEQIQQLEQYIASLTQAKEGETKWAWHYFVKYIAATIYGSQVKLVQSLRDEGPKGSENLLSFYQLFLQRAQRSSNYNFAAYIEYLTSNALIQLDSSKSKYVITELGEHFLKVIEEHGINWNTLHN